MFIDFLHRFVIEVTIFGLRRIQSEKIKAVRPRVRLDNRNPVVGQDVFGR